MAKGAEQAVHRGGTGFVRGQSFTVGGRPDQVRGAPGNPVNKRDAQTFGQSGGDYATPGAIGGRNGDEPSHG